MLHRAARAAGVQAGMTLDEIFIQAYGGPNGIGADDVGNSRKGRLGRDKAAKIHQWIARRYPKIGQQAAPQLFGSPPGDAFAEHIQMHARSGQLGIKPLRQFGLIERVRDATQPDETLSLGQPFCFSLASEVEGVAIARQGYKGNWHALPLGPDGFPTTPIHKGSQFLPRDHDGAPIELFEREDIGMHRFVVMVGPPKLADRLETFDTDIPDLDLLSQSEVHQLYLFVGSANGEG